MLVFGIGNSLVRFRLFCGFDPKELLELLFWDMEDGVMESDNIWIGRLDNILSLYKLSIESLYSVTICSRGLSSASSSRLVSMSSISILSLEVISESNVGVDLFGGLLKLSLSSLFVSEVSIFDLLTVFGANGKAN